MIKDGFFTISFPELISTGSGSIIFAEDRTDNYFKDVLSRETMCCNCDKGGGPGPIPLPPE